MTEAIALAKLKSGDQEALGWFIDRYGAYVGAIVNSILYVTMSRADVEEVTADVFIALWRSAGKLIPLNLKGYLGRIARNTALKKLREQRQELPLEEDMLVLEEDSLIEGMTLRERDTLVREAVLSMPELDREIFLRHYYYCQTVPVIAEKLGLKPNTVKSRLLRGREKLRQSLTGIEAMMGGG